MHPERRNKCRSLLRWPSPLRPHRRRYSENINWFPYNSNELMALWIFPSIMQVWHAAVTEGNLWSHIYHVGYKENRIWHFCAVYTNIKNYLSSLFKLPPGQWVSFSFDDRIMFSLSELELQDKIYVHIYIYIYKCYPENIQKRKTKINKEYVTVLNKFWQELESCCMENMAYDFTSGKEKTGEGNAFMWPLACLWFLLVII